MNRIPALLVTAVLTLKAGTPGLDQTRLKEGDLVFQTSRSSQSRAVQLATHSTYSHMGILFQRRGAWEVLEAVGPVKWTPLAQWVRRGVRGHVVVKRLRNREARLTPAALARMKTVGARFLGRPYDLTFEWSDTRIYCSELVWKVYQEGAGLELGRLQTLGEFDLSSPQVQAKLRARYHGGPPLQEPVISPVRIFECAELETILSH